MHPYCVPFQTRPLIQSALADPDNAVRRAAVDAAATFGNDDTAVPFVKALYSSHPGLVANAAQAIAGLGDPRGIVYIVKRISSHGGSGRVVAGPDSLELEGRIGLAEKTARNCGCHLGLRMELSF